MRTPLNGNRTGGATLPEVLATFAVFAVILVFVSTYVAIVTKAQTSARLLELSQVVLSWEVIAGGIAIKFAPEISNVLKKWSR